MIAAMQATFHFMQSTYHFFEALYNSGPVVMNSAGLGLLGLMVVAFVKGKSNQGLR